MDSTLLHDLLLAPLAPLLDIQGQFFWLHYVSTAAIAGAFYLWLRRGKKSSLRGMMRYLFPKKLWLHPSTLLDARLYLFSSVYVVLQGAFIFGGIPMVGEQLAQGLDRYVFYLEPSMPPIWLKLLIPLIFLLTLELGYWLAHCLFHRVPYLWEFHRVHHSAEVLTPLTEWRQHPLEFLVFTGVIGLVNAVPYGLAVWAYGSEWNMLPWWNSTAMMFLLFSTLLHLRHSHVNIHFPRWLGHIIQTPAHHHIHHSVEPRHFDKNMGYLLMVWDWAFGTLYLPERDQKIAIGLGEEGRELNTVRACVSVPFRRLYRRWRPAPLSEPTL